MPGRMRARDIDRAETATVLDAAYAEGQLGADEYHDRLAQVRAARTLGELAESTADLQGACPGPVVPRPVRSGGRGRYFAVLGAAALAVAFGTFTLTHREAGPMADPPPAPPEAAQPVSYAALDTVEPRVIATPDLVSGAGVAHFIATYRATFGDTVADEVTLYPAHARVVRALPGQPNRKVSYTYRGGFRQDSEVTTRAPDTPTVDLAAVDSAAIGAAADSATAVTRVPDGLVSMIEVEISSIDPAPNRTVVGIHVDNSFDESGWFLLAPAGEVLRVWPFDG